MTTGRRYGGADAAAAGLVDGAVAEELLVETAAQVVAPLGGKDAATLGTIKSTMFAAVSTALTGS